MQSYVEIRLPNDFFSLNEDSISLTVKAASSDHVSEIFCPSSSVSWLFHACTSTMNSPTESVSTFTEIVEPKYVISIIRPTKILTSFDSSLQRAIFIFSGRSAKMISSFLENFSFETSCWKYLSAMKYRTLFPYKIAS